jgi:uncharacterized protein YjgD (DUF1641 family)
MEKDALILERLESLEEKIAPMSETVKAVGELREELAPRVNEAVHALIRQLADVEADFQLEDLLFLIKKAMRNVQNFGFVLDQMKNLIDFTLTAEPLLKASVPRLIEVLDEMERNGVFRLARTGLEVLGKIGTHYSKEDLDQIGDGVIRMMGILKTLTSPKSLDFLERAAELPGSLDLDGAKETGPVGLLFSLGGKEGRRGLGVLVELTKGLGALKPAG